MVSVPADTTGRSKVLRGDIEGLRALAVGTVLLYHVGMPFIPGGFVGVDIFFVISGFLITSLLLREAAATGTVSIADFYARRARRLLPAASLVLVVTAGAGWLILPGADRVDLGIDVAAASLYVVNWALALRSVDYLAEDAAPSAVQHYWSLSVEEQFYVVWPLVILLGLVVARRTRMRPKRLLFGVLALLAGASFIHSVTHTASGSTTAYFITTTRIWELALGALLAFLVERLTALPRMAAEVLAALGLVLVLWSALAIDAATPWPGSWALVPTLGAALVIAAGCAHRETVTARLLGVRPMVWIGGLSYAIYLWHWPLITLATAAWPDVRSHHLLVLGGLSILLAWLTKHLVEDPIRFHPGLGARARRGLLFGAATMLATLLVAGAVWSSVPRLDPGARVAGATSLVADPASAHWRVREDASSVFTTDGPVTPHPAVATRDVPAYEDDDCQVTKGDSEVNTSCVYGDTDSDTTIAMLGDSKMGQWFPAVAAIADAEGWRLELYLKSGCAFTERGEAADCNAFGRNLADHFDTTGAPDLALVSQVRADPEVRDGTTESIRTLQARGTRVIVLADSPRPVTPKVYACVETHEGDYSACAFDAAGQGRKGSGTPNLAAAAAETGAPFVDLNAWICPPGSTCPAVIADTLVYRQGSHVTASYVRSLTPMLYRDLARLGVTTRPIDEITVDDIP